MIKLDEQFIMDFKDNELIVMLRLLLTANEGKVKIVSRKFADKCGISRQQLRTILANLRQKGEIETMTINPQNNPRSNPSYTLVTICKFEDYRSKEKKSTHRATQGATQEKLKEQQEACNKRAKEFEKSLIPFVKTKGGIYEPEMIRAFCNYWTEKNKIGTRMRFEIESTWETSKRLTTWLNKDMKYGKSNSITRNVTADKRASRESLENLANRILGGDKSTNL